MPDIAHHGHPVGKRYRDRELVAEGVIAPGFRDRHYPCLRPAVGVPAPWRHRNICCNRNHQTDEYDKSQSTLEHNKDCVGDVQYKLISANDPIIQIINSLSEFCETRRKFVRSEYPTLQKISQKLVKIKKYLEPFKDGKIGFGDYFTMRHDKIIDTGFKDNPNKTQTDGLRQERKYYSEGTVIEIERRIFKEIIEC